MLRPHHHRLPLLLALLFPSTLAAAQDDGGEGLTQEELEDVTEDIKQDVEELRGLAFERPVAVAVTGREGFLDYVKKRMLETSSPEEIRAQEDIGKLLGLLPADYDLWAETLAVLEEQVGGFYDPASDGFYLMEGFGGGIARIILAHELTHALDDQHFDIDGHIAERLGDSDALFAYHAVVEGSGTSIMNRWTIEHLAELDAQALAGGGGLSMDVVAKVPPYVWRPLIATYLGGASFLVRSDSLMAGQMKPADPRDIDQAFEAPPRSSEQVLHPEKYWDPEQRDEPRAVAFDVARLPAGWEVQYRDTLGELGLALVTQPLEERGGLDPRKILGLRFTDAAASGWDGDQALLLGSGARRVLLVATVWDPPREGADEPIDEGLESSERLDEPIDEALESSERLVEPIDEALEFSERLVELLPSLNESLQALATALGLEAHGLEVRHASGSDTVLVAAGVGVETAELRALMDAVPFEVSDDEVRTRPASAEGALPAGGR